MFTYQENTHFSQALPCTKEVFWEQVKKPNTAWRIDARRAILAAVDASKTQGVAALQTWLNNADYQKFLLKKRNLKKESAKKAWATKSDAEKLLAFAQEIKDNSTAFIYSCREFDETETSKGAPFRHRRLADCHLNGLVMLDIDHVENPMDIWYKLRDNEELMKRVALVHITSSGFGARIVFTADIKDGNLADNQIVFAEKLGYQPDESCIDATRNSFSPKEEDILYINEELLFDYYDEDFDKRFTPEYREKRTQPLYHEFPSVYKGTDAENKLGTDAENKLGTDSTDLHGFKKEPENPVAVNKSSDNPCNPCQKLKWRGYDIQGIIDQRYAAKLPCAADSNRHNESLKLATDLLLMLDGDKALVQRIVEAQSWVKEIIDERDENVEQTVASAAECVAQKEKKYASSQPSKVMLEAIKAFTGKTYQEIVKGESEQQGANALYGQHKIQQMLQGWGEEIEALFPDFPLLKDICEGLKKSQYPAALFVGGGTAMTLMTRTWYRFYHRPQQERRLNCSLYIIGHPASNKSMADDIYKILSAPIAAADKAGKAALNRYKQDLKKKAANKEGKDKPQGIIRIHPARTSNGQLIQDMLNAKETIDGKEIQLHMLTFDTELDNATMLQQGGSWINKQSMELKAFHNEEDGQMYQNSDSPVDEFNVTWNYIYTGTPIALKRKVNERNFGSGLSTRLAVIPMPKTNYEMIELEDVNKIDWARLDRMKTWAYRLDSRYGELPLWPLVVKMHGWVKNRMEDCAEDDSEANELMLKRVPYHALNYAAPFIDMRHWDSLHQENNHWIGEYEVDETDWKLCELIARIQYATQQHFFGVMAEKYFDDMNNDVQIVGKRHQQRSLDGYYKLPDTFTREDVLKCFGYDNENSVNTKLRRLLEGHLIEKISEGKNKGCYKKVNRMVI
ncbi:MAG: hypothetical protein IJQ60_05605 [Prevotella sp.]|nr:hypothetical protein [Prevotella sp.]